MCGSVFGHIPCIVSGQKNSGRWARNTIFETLSMLIVMLNMEPAEFAV